MMKKEQKIRIVAILGSVRRDSFTRKALDIVLAELKNSHSLEVDILDPGCLTLAFPGESEGRSVKDIKAKVAQATGIILATPEYHGSYSSVIKLIIENLGYPSVLAGKPVVLLGVASGQIGAIKALEHLRSVCAHIGAVVLPDVVSVAGVHQLFDDQGKCLDPKVDKRLRSLASVLLNYILKHICPQKAFEEIVRGK